MITPSIKRKIQSIVSVFETSSANPRYDILVTLPDGPRDGQGNRRQQITYGKHQTTEYGNLKGLVKMYCDAYSKYSGQLRPYLSKIGSEPLAANEPFKRLLKQAAEDPVMQEIQDRFFDQFYWDPAVKFFGQEGFTLPLSMLVIYDSYIHSGGILKFLRERFAARTPASKGEERAWITEYVRTRDQWLENHSDRVLRNTDYRTDCLLDQIKMNNWDLTQQVVCKFNQADKAQWVVVS